MSLWNEWSWEVAMEEAKGQLSWKISAALHTSPDIFHNILLSVRPTFPAFLFLFFTFFHQRSLFSRWMKGERGRKRRWRRRRQGRARRGGHGVVTPPPVIVAVVEGGRQKRLKDVERKRKDRRTVDPGGGEQVEGVHGSREGEREGEGPLTCHSEQETTEALRLPSRPELSENIWPGRQGKEVTDRCASTRQTSGLRPIRIDRKSVV